MKKVLYLVIFIISIIGVSYFDFGNRVFRIENPAEIYVDLNNNLVFDEKNPVILPNLHYINKNTDYSKHPVFSCLNDKEKFFLEYKAFDTSQKLLKNRYVKIKNDDIFIHNKSYSKEILASKFVFDDTVSSQKALVENVKSINLDDYVILNIKNKKYHSLDCDFGLKSASYKIVKRSEISNEIIPCKSCILPNRNIPDNINLKSLSDFNKYVYSEPNIKIFFIDLNKIFKPDNQCLDNACKSLKYEIDNTQKTIDLAIYGLNNQPKIMQALINAKKRGVKIRRVYDYSPKKYYKDNDKLDNIIPDFKTDEEYDKINDSALMHNKYFIFDDKKVWTGSSNISSTDLSGFNANYAALLESQAIAQKYKEDFEQMYSGIFHKSKIPSNSGFIRVNENTQVKPLFSPQDNIINTEIIPLIKSAKKYIYMNIFFITHKGIEKELISASKRGVEIKIINDATNAHTRYSIHKNLRKENIKVKTENYAGKMHAKTIIIDNEYSIIGSMNFTKSGNSRNDENVVIIKSSGITKYMRLTFNYLWNKIPEKYEKYDVRAESEESIGSCYDGIDNDFDEKIDGMDDGCIIK